MRPLTPRHLLNFSPSDSKNKVNMLLCQVTIIYLAPFQSRLCQGNFTVLNREIVKQNCVPFLWPDETSSLILGCNKVRLCRGLIWFLWSCSDGHLDDEVCLWGSSIADMVSADIQGCRGHLSVLIHHLDWIWTGYG